MWEWRYFAPRDPSSGDDLKGCREDVYWPACDAVGLKLRNGDGHLELKARSEVSPDGVMPGRAERWHKSLHSGCVSALAGPSLRLDALSTALSKALGAAAPVASPVETCFAPFGGRPPPLRVHCRKRRRYTKVGEEVDIVLLAYLDSDGPTAPPRLIERWHSVSIEMHDLAKLAEAVNAAPAPPPDARVTGYPGLIVDIARRVLSAELPPPIPAAAATPAAAAEAPIAP